MKQPRKYRLPQPARQTEPLPPLGTAAMFPTTIAPAGSPVTLLPGCPAPEILTAPRIPRRWLHVTLAFPASADSAAVALAAAWFATRMRAIDKRLRLTLNRERCAATAGELVLAFAPLRGGSLAAEWLEEVKIRVRELAAEFVGAELKSVEVVKEE